jgi:phosphatidylglycerol---prolipoprotein diacylglyceryl transferase
MFVDSIDPVLFQLGPFQIRYYGIVYMIGFLIAYFLMRGFAKKGTIRNFDIEKTDTLILYMIIGLIAGARLFVFIFYEWQTLWSRPLEILFIWHGGMSFHGGLIGVIVATVLFCRKYDVRFYDLADIIVIPAAFALFLGRIANFTNSELVGIIADPKKTPWCVVYPKVDSSCRHPSQLYEAGYSLIIFSSLLVMHLKKRWKAGTIFWSFALLYGSFRFIENFWREEVRWFFGISTGQLLSLIMVPVALYFLMKVNRKGKK